MITGESVKKLLCIVGKMDAGGAETFLMKIYRQLDKKLYQMDFAVGSPEPGFYDKEIEAMGGKIFHITPKSVSMIKNFADIKKITKEGRYFAVLRVSQNSLAALELLAAKMGGAKKRVFRSSNSKPFRDTPKEKTIHKAFMWMPRMFANVRVAPSIPAAEFMFGKGCIEKKRALILRNGLDLKRFQFSPEDRDSVRSSLGCGQKLVIGHIGRFNHQKNHAFLLQVFSEIKRLRPDSMLLLCGKGETEEKIRNDAKKLGLEQDVVFLGVRDDIPRVLTAMDVFVFPSFYEGMPNTVIEAQASGLPCVIADTITREAAVTETCIYLKLSDDPQSWAKKAIWLSQQSMDRRQALEELKLAGYDIADAATNFIDIVFRNN